MNFKSTTTRVPIITCAWTIDELNREKLTERLTPVPIVVRGTPRDSAATTYTLLLDDHSYLLSSTREYLLFSSMGLASNFLTENGIHQFKVDLSTVALCGGIPPKSRPAIPVEKNGLTYYLSREEIDLPK